MIIINNRYIATHEGLLDMTTGGDTMVDFSDVVDNITKIDLVQINKYDKNIWLKWREEYKWLPSTESIGMF